MAIPGAGPLPQPSKKALAAQKKAAASLSLNKKGQDPAATVVDVPKQKDEGSSGRPNKAEYDQEQDSLRSQIDSLQTKLNDLKNKIQNSSLKGGPNHERKIELRKQLDELRNEQGKVRGGRGKTVEQLGTMQEGLKKKIAELQTAKAKVPYKTVQDVDNQIKSLDRQVESGTMKLVDEKKALSEISSLRKSRKTVEGFSTLQASIDQEKKKIDEVRALLDDPEQKRLDERFKETKKELDEVNKRMDEQSKARDGLFEERNEISKELDELFTKKKASAQAFREANNKYYEKLNADRAKRDAQRREERRLQEASKRSEINERLLEEAQAPAFEREIEDCRNLILYFQSRIGQTPTTSSTENAANGGGLGGKKEGLMGVPKLELRKVEEELPKGTIVRKKGQEEVDETGWGAPVKNKKKQNGNNNKNSSSSSTSTNPNPTTNEDQVLNLPFQTLAGLMSLGITAPLKVGNVERTIENLNLKKKYFTDNQDRVTKERVAAVEKKIEQAESSANGGGSKSNGAAASTEVEAVASIEPGKVEEEVKAGAEEVAVPEKEQENEEGEGEKEVEEKKDEEPFQRYVQNSRATLDQTRIHIFFFPLHLSVPTLASLGFSTASMSSSSSDLEILPSAPVAKNPSPPKPRVSSRARRPPRGRDELAAPAAPVVARSTTTTGPSKISRKRKEVAVTDKEEEESINKRLPSDLPALPPVTAVPIASSSKQFVPNLIPPPTASIPKLAPVSSSSAPTRIPSKSKLSTSPPPPRRSSTNPTITTASTSTSRRSSTPKVATKKPYVKPAAGGDSSDELDDFFNRSKVKTNTTTTKGKARIPGGRVPAMGVTGGGGAGGGRVPKISSGRSSVTPGIQGATSPPKPPIRKFVPSSSSSSSSSDSDTSKSSSAPAHATTNYSSDHEPMTKDLSLPDWARGNGKARAGMSGADWAKLKKGFRKNRKRRRLSQETDEEAEKAKKRMDEEDGEGMGEGEETDDSLEIEVTSFTKGKGKGKEIERPKRPGLKISLADEDEDEEDEEEDYEGGGGKKGSFVVSEDEDETPGPTPRKGLVPPLKTKTPSPPKKSAAQLLLETARALKAASPLKSPQRSTTTTTTSTTITINSSPSSSSNDDTLDPALAAIRSGLKSKRSQTRARARAQDPDLEILEPVAGVKDQGKVTVLLRMNYDPTLPQNATVKRIYEKEERFELGINQSFSHLFDQLSSKRYLNRNDLVITYQKSQLYDFGTPSSLRLSSGDTVEMKAFTREVWEKTKRIEKEKREKGMNADEQEEEELAALERAVSMTRGGSLQPPPGASSSTLQSQSLARSRSPSATATATTSAQPRSPDHNLFRLTIRGSKTQSIDLAVKLSTTMQSLVKAFSKQFGITDRTRIEKMWIEVDGDRMEPTRTVSSVKEEFEFEGEETVDLKDPGA
ncbi:Bfr1p [Sporobolomyces salmoneus]|uniref:Bfr1p n=1 Tax=Sporobolomyces salmoneus TaxID=183962 RepID=UPI003179E1B7